MNTSGISRLLGAAAFAVACGSSALPPAQIARAQAAVSAAEAVGAPNNPRAALHLKLANDQIRQAEALVRDDEPEAAAIVLERARADAELAFLITRREQEQLDARRAQERVRELE